MFKGDHTLGGPDDPDAQLERELADLGPLMVRQERAEASLPDPAFAATLRARLVEGSSTAPPSRQRPVLRLASWGGLAAALAAAILIAVFHRNASPTPVPHPVAVLFHPPTPGAGDLTKSYPVLGGLGGGGLVDPVISRIEEVHGQAYPGHLTLTTGPLSRSQQRLEAYQLAPVARPLDARVRTLARALGIGGALSTRTGYIQFGDTPRAVTYLAVAQGGNTVINPIRSVAVSQFDGRLIFHDTTDDAKSQSTIAPVARDRAVALARGWMATLGWPGARMPVQAATVFALAPGGITQISFGWPGVARSDAPAATVWVNGFGRVTEALLRPVIARTTPIPTLSIARAWSMVEGGHVPLGVKIIPRDPTLPGTGHVNRVTVEQILTTTSTGAQYLVPAYRFEGRVHIVHTPGQYLWYGLVPAVHAR